MNPAFERYIGNDYPDAQSPRSSLKGLRVYEANRLAALRPAARQGPRAFLAVRRVEFAAQLLGGRGSLSFAVEPDFPQRGTNARPARRYATAEWLRRADCAGSLQEFLRPELEPHECKTAEIEGWILGVA